MNPLILGTDFSGLGSVEEAIKRLKVNHRIAFACDKDKHAKASYLANHNAEIFFDDITQRDQMNTSYCDMYVFGFPCQAFSMAGNRKGFQDTCGTLFYNALEYIDKKRPRFFIGENVKGLLSHNKLKGSKSKYGRTFGVIRDSLATTVNGQHNLYKYDDCVNYHIHFFVMNTKNFGIPQNRERIFIIGFRDEADSLRFNKPKSFELKLRLKDLLENIVDEKYFLSEEMISKLVIKNTENQIGYINQDTQSSKVFSIENESPSLCAGTHGYANGYIVINDANMLSFKRNEFGKKIRKQYENGIIKEKRQNIQNLLPRNDGISNSLTTNSNKENLILVFDDNYSTNRVYDSEGLARTLKSNSGVKGRQTGLYLINFKIRRLTPIECFRLMGYDDIFFKKCALVNSDTQLYKQAGNSIVVDTIMHLLIQIFKATDIKYSYD